MNIIKDFLLQIMLIAVPMFTYHTFFEGRLKNDQYKNIIKSILWGVSIILCMSFPMFVDSGFHLDLRAIPLLLGTLYCGFGTGMFLSILMILYRYYLGAGVEIGLYHSVLSVFMSIPVILFFQRAFERTEKRKRVKIAVLLSFYYSLVVIGGFFALGMLLKQDMTLAVTFLVYIVSAAWFFTMLNENIREVNQMRQEMQNAERQRVISELSSVFAHEIRNPVQVARGFLQLMDNPDLPEEKKKRYIQISIDELDRANEIIIDFLSFSKPQTEKKELFDVSDQLQRVVNMIDTYASSQNVSIQLNAEAPCMIAGNVQKFKQSLINIMKNGIEAMPEGGLLQVNCSKQNNNYVVIDIIDQGVGMTKDQLGRLGTPFYSLKEKGTGIGLMVSFNIIQSLNGKIKVRSELGKGSTFTILLPISRETGMEV